MIQSLARGMDILSILERKGSASIKELAEELSVDKSTASRLVDTMVHYDMIRLDPNNKKYRLGFRILYLGDGVRRGIDVATVARPHMDRLCEETKESVHLAAVSNGLVYVIDQVRSKREYNLAAHIGMIEAWHCSSVGKCILAYQSPKYMEQTIAENELTGYTENTITSPEKLKEALVLVKQKGFSIDDEERSMGVRCIAAPIFNYSGHVKYSIGISGPTAHITPSNIKDYVLKTVNCSRKISDELGYRLFGK